MTEDRKEFIGKLVRDQLIFLIKDDLPPAAHTEMFKEVYEQLEGDEFEVAYDEMRRVISFLNRKHP